MSSDWPVASALLAGRYRLVTLLETGGMAEIWRAEDQLLDRLVAIKLPTGPQIVWREARMAARLSHPGIAAVHDYREAVRPDGTVMPFVVMELLTGESVAARVDREVVGWAETARIGAAVADALAAAHASGVVHRDIKPGNVMLTPNGVKILDFGISVAAGEPDDDDTGATFGTPAYVAPERLDGMPAEPATDVYGVGVLLFEMVTGDPPYPVETWEELAAARLAGPSTLPESLPTDFRDVIERCLDADPARRPTAARLRADLLGVALRPAASASAASGKKEANAVVEVAAPTPPKSGERTGTASSLLGDLVRATSSSSGRGVGPAGTIGPAGVTGSRAVSAEAIEDRDAAGDSTGDWEAATGSNRGRDLGSRRATARRNFATGRAAAATLEMEAAPRRRVAFRVGVTAVLTALIGAFAVIAWTHRDTDTDVAIPPPATAPVLPTVTATTPQPSTAKSTPASPSRTASLTFADAKSRMRAAVEGGVESGQIRQDVAQDLLNLLRPLSNAQASDVDGQVAALRRKIQIRVGEGGLTPARATVLQSRLADLYRAART
jgi:serine/threonine protein kinase